MRVYKLCTEPLCKEYVSALSELVCNCSVSDRKKSYVFIPGLGVFPPLFLQSLSEWVYSASFMPMVYFFLREDTDIPVHPQF